MSERHTIGVDENNYYENLLDLEGLDREVRRPTDGWRTALELLFDRDRCDAVEHLLTNPVPEELAQKISRALETKKWIYDGLRTLNEGELGALSPKRLALRELELWSGTRVSEERLQVETPVREDWVARGIDPHDPLKLLDFYRTTESYIWELMAANNLIETLFNYHVLLRTLQERGVTDFLDYGAGAGSFLIAARRVGIEGAHMDLASKTMEYARWRYEARDLEVPLIEASGHHDDLPPFKAVVCLEVIEHLSNPLSLLDAFRQAIPPGGLLVVSESCKYVEKFSTHLESNRWLGGNTFTEQMRRRGFREVNLTLRIHPRIFHRVVAS